MGSLDDGRFLVDLLEALFELLEGLFVDSVGMRDHDDPGPRERGEWLAQITQRQQTAGVERIDRAD